MVVDLFGPAEGGEEEGALLPPPPSPLLYVREIRLLLVSFGIQQASFGT
jgi:hypothetical protein